MVIFGAAGDLAKRLLIPALYNLAKAGLLDDGFKVLGVDHNARDDAIFRHDVTGFLEELTTSKDSEAEVRALDPDVMKWLSDRLFYQVADFTDAASQRLRSGAGCCGRIARATAAQIRRPRRDNRRDHRRASPALLGQIADDRPVSFLHRRPPRRQRLLRGE